MEFIITENDVNEAFVASKDKPILIYKHSPICGLSDTAIIEWERFVVGESDRFRFYQVDVIAAREASLRIASLTSVRHESPQVLLIWKSACPWNVSHRQIRSEKIKLQADQFFNSQMS
jgi:bacillithiol system protein YtxJ